MKNLFQNQTIRISLLNAAIGILDMTKEFLVRCRDQEVHKLEQSKESNALCA